MKTATPTRRNVWVRSAAIFAVLFGVLTIVSGGTALFGSEEAKAMAGNTVAFVLWFNFLAGFLYVVAGIGLHAWRPWASRLALLIAVANMLVLLAFTVHVFSGYVYEMRTVWAMLFRCGVWITIAMVAFKFTPPKAAITN